MKILSILLCSLVLSCTSMKFSNLEYTTPDVTLRIENLEFYNVDPENISEILKAIGNDD